MKTKNRKIDYQTGNLIRDMMDRSGLTREDWADQLDISTRMVGYYCSGEKKPSLNRFLRIVKIAGGLNAKDIP